MKDNQQVIKELLDIGIISIKDGVIMCEGYSMAITKIFAQAYRELDAHSKGLSLFQQKVEKLANERK